MTADTGQTIQESVDRIVDTLRTAPDFQHSSRVVAAMSGGIDSSVMAALLHLAGFQVIGISMRFFDKGADPLANTAATGRCCTLDDFQDARRVAHSMGFDHYVMDFGERFKREVMDPFVASYLMGDTPTPCILCNKHLKFDSLLSTADELEARFVAAGHYAKILSDAQGFHLLKGTDHAKDQSYFLFPHTQATLSRTLFPLESIPKSLVRKIALHLGLGLEEKRESQEICFVSQDRYTQFIEESGAAPPLDDGLVKHISDGRVLGHHKGYWRFTVGQRKGLGIAYPEPLYVVRTDPATNTVWAGEESQLFGIKLEARDVSWCLSPPSGDLDCHAKLRSRSPEVPALIQPLSLDRVRIQFTTPQRAITPGQAIVFYQGEEVLGGGWIDQLNWAP